MGHGIYFVLINDTSAFSLSVCYSDIVSMYVSSTRPIKGLIEQKALMLLLSCDTYAPKDFQLRSSSGWLTC